jgi:hypothetical protein
MTRLSILAILALFTPCLPQIATASAGAVVTVSPLPVRAPASQAAGKSEVLARLKTLQSHQSQEIVDLETAIKKQLKASTAVTLKDDWKVTDRKISRLGDDLDQLQKRRAEVSARRDFINQLVLILDSRWDGKNLQTFLEHQLLDMATNELTNPQGEPSPLWKFVTYLSVAIREVPERQDDVLSIAESYMNFASVLNPKTPAEFLANRNYTNTEMSVAARPANRETLGDFLEKRMQDLNPTPKATRASRVGPRPDIELRLKVPTPPREESAPESPTTPENSTGNSPENSNGISGVKATTADTRGSEPILPLTAPFANSPN